MTCAHSPINFSSWRPYCLYFFPNLLPFSFLISWVVQSPVWYGTWKISQLTLLLLFLHDSFSLPISISIPISRPLQPLPSSPLQVDLFDPYLSSHLCITSHFSTTPSSPDVHRRLRYFTGIRYGQNWWSASGEDSSWTNDAQHEVKALTFYCSTLHFTALQCSTLLYTALLDTALPYTALLYTTLPYTAVLYAALHCTALHCTSLLYSADSRTPRINLHRLHLTRICISILSLISFVPNVEPIISEYCRVTLLESGGDASSFNRIYATDRLTGELLLMESDHVIVATDPETAKALLRDGVLCCGVVCCDMASCGVIWHRVVWCGVVWCNNLICHAWLDLA